jgi:uncharacterized protein (DUF1810 family)
MDPPFNLQRFVRAQNPVIETVRAELAAGQKRSHWMWFVFPQLKGLGSSSMSTEFGISGLGEAAEYLKDPILGPRLRECTRLVNLIQGRPIREIFSPPDDLKFWASITLFSQLDPDCEEFAAALQKYFQGKQHKMTLDRLSPTI